MSNYLPNFEEEEPQNYLNSKPFYEDKNDLFYSILNCPQQEEFHPVSDQPNEFYDEFEHSSPPNCYDPFFNSNHSQQEIQLPEYDVYEETFDENLIPKSKKAKQSNKKRPICKRSKKIKKIQNDSETEVQRKESKKDLSKKLKQCQLLKSIVAQMENILAEAKTSIYNQILKNNE